MLGKGGAIRMFHMSEALKSVLTDHLGSFGLYHPHAQATGVLQGVEDGGGVFQFFISFFIFFGPLGIWKL